MKTDRWCSDFYLFKKWCFIYWTVYFWGMAYLHSTEEGVRFSVAGLQVVVSCPLWLLKLNESAERRASALKFWAISLVLPTVTLFFFQNSVKSFCVWVFFLYVCLGTMHIHLIVSLRKLAYKHFHSLNLNLFSHKMVLCACI